MDTLKINNLGLDRDVLEYLEDMMTEYTVNIMIPYPDEKVIEMIEHHNTLSTYYSQLIEKENENYNNQNRKRLGELPV